MKAVILAGGKGSRLGEGAPPKPLVEIGSKPVLWHVMSILASAGIQDIVVALGHRADDVRHYLQSAARQTEHGNELHVFNNGIHNWAARLVNTGENTATGGRIYRLRDHLAGERFLLSWTDGLTNADIRAMVDFHLRHGKLATVLATHPPARFGKLTINDDNQVSAFLEKQSSVNDWINGGLFIFEPEALDFIAGDDSSLEYDVLPVLAQEKELMAWRHEGFWQCMDYQHEINVLDDLWESGRAPWKSW